MCAVSVCVYSAAQLGSAQWCTCGRAVRMSDNRNGAYYATDRPVSNISK